jgi:hypothetical protein
MSAALTWASSLSTTDAYALSLVPDMVSGAEITVVDPNADRRAQRAIVTANSGPAASAPAFADPSKVRRT